MRVSPRRCQGYRPPCQHSGRSEWLGAWRVRKSGPWGAGALLWSVLRWGAEVAGRFGFGERLLAPLRGRFPARPRDFSAQPPVGCLVFGGFRSVSAVGCPRGAVPPSPRQNVVRRSRPDRFAPSTPADLHLRSSFFWGGREDRLLGVPGLGSRVMREGVSMRPRKSLDCGGSWRKFLGEGGSFPEGTHPLSLRLSQFPPDFRVVPVFADPPSPVPGSPLPGRRGGGNPLTAEPTADPSPLPSARKSPARPAVGLAGQLGGRSQRNLHPILPPSQLPKVPCQAGSWAARSPRNLRSILPPSPAPKQIPFAPTSVEGREGHLKA